MKKIRLTQGTYTRVSDEDYERANRYKWSLLKGGYAVRSVCKDGKQTILYLHRFILDAPKGIEVDHKSGDKLDNTRENLRLATRVQNLYNTRIRPNTRSGYKGVRLTISNKWQAYLRINKTFKNLGSFINKEEAAIAYNKAAMTYFGDFAHINKL
jgi:hypothetical protein